MNPRAVSPPARLTLPVRILASHVSLWPAISSTHRTHFSRTNSSNPDRRTRIVIPNPPAPSLGQSVRAVGITTFLPPAPSFTPFTSVSVGRISLPITSWRESCWSPRGPCSDDRIPSHLPPAQQFLFFVDERESRDRKRRGRQNHQNGASQDQFQQGHTLF